MKIIEIVESKQWQNIETGQTASIFGAVPYSSDKDKKQWRIISRGYTWRLDNGTVGLGRMPVKTLNEALKIMHEFNKGK